MRRLLVLIAGLLLLFVSALSAWASSAPRDKSFLSAPHVTIPCSTNAVPYAVYAMPITHTETLTLTFQASGAGIITFMANNYDQALWARTDATCGSCTLVIPNVPPGPLNTLQLSATAATLPCPDPGMAVSNFVLTVSP
jgi:hypothetical protein